MIKEALRGRTGEEMKVVIVYDGQKWQEHLQFSCILRQICEEEGYEVALVDLANIQAGYEKKKMIVSHKPDLLVTLDLAGFEMRTLAEKATYNVMPYRMAHILLHKYAEYQTEWLEDDMNFSMFFYAAEQTATDIMRNHPSIEKVIPLCLDVTTKWVQDQTVLQQLADTIIQDTEIAIDYQ